ncbi:hypothetical protein [Actinopolymorpha pittospori]|uniref:ARB-07466-like C-terminal domain-containing protein n=1 Tax=Actinopolymorpha pittospori TaxID=648752 RepID=A0A927N5U8_9ACTN|nr:hypothetical protein [Actinopolymorpha pittospori]MBE1612654.1 hypothetical protein [Actinopolymorpha pittospori]
MPATTVPLRRRHRPAVLLVAVLALIAPVAITTTSQVASADPEADPADTWTVPGTLPGTGPGEDGGVGAARTHVYPRTPNFPPTIDAYATYQGGTTCSPMAKAGVVDVRDLVLRTYGRVSWAIVQQPCSSSVNEHKEGRALDIGFDARTTTGYNQGNDFLHWLLFPDQYGNANAMARRLGVMYVIWNRRMWRAYNPRGWQPYTGSDPHVNHVHISFSWRGAMRGTTWWTLGGTGAVPPAMDPDTIEGLRRPADLP